MDIRDSKAVLYQQLSLDFCCTLQELRGRNNVFTVWKPMDGRRLWGANKDCFLKAASIGGKLVMCGREDIITECRAVFADASGDWFMEVGRFRQLEAMLRPYGYQVGQAHPFYIPGKLAPVPEHDFDVIRYDRQAIEQFRGDGRYDEAFAFDENAPDVLGIAAVRNGQIIGMAGASCDSPLMWQIGINVEREARGFHVGSTLVRMLMDDVYAAGAMPFYGTSQSNIASQRVAAYAGFLPAWAELSTEPIPNGDNNA